MNLSTFTNGMANTTTPMSTLNGNEIASHEHITTRSESDLASLPNPLDDIKTILSTPLNFGPSLTVPPLDDNGKVINQHNTLQQSRNTTNNNARTATSMYESLNHRRFILDFPIDSELEATDSRLDALQPHTPDSSLGSTTSRNPQSPIAPLTTCTKNSEGSFEHTQAAQPMTPSHSGNGSTAILKIPTIVNGVVQPPTPAESVSPKGKEKAVDQGDQGLNSQFVGRDWVATSTPTTSEQYTQAASKLHYNGQNFTPQISSESSQDRLISPPTAASNDSYGSNDSDFRTPVYHNADESFSEMKQRVVQKHNQNHCILGQVPAEAQGLTSITQPASQPASFQPKKALWILGTVRKAKEKHLQEKKEKMVESLSNYPDPDEDVTNFAPILLDTPSSPNINASRLLPFGPGFAGSRESERFRMLDPRPRRADAPLAPGTIQTLSRYGPLPRSPGNENTVSDSEYTPNHLIGSNPQPDDFNRTVLKLRAVRDNNFKLLNEGSFTVDQRIFERSNAFPPEAGNGESPRLDQRRVLRSNAPWSERESQHERFDVEYQGRRISDEQREDYHNQGGRYNRSKYHSSYYGPQSVGSHLPPSAASATPSFQASERGMGDNVLHRRRLVEDRQNTRQSYSESFNGAQLSTTPRFPSDLRSNTRASESASFPAASIRPDFSTPLTPSRSTGSLQQGMSAASIVAPQPIRLVGILRGTTFSQVAPMQSGPNNGATPGQDGPTRSARTTQSIGSFRNLPQASQRNPARTDILQLAPTERRNFRSDGNWRRRS